MTPSPFFCFVFFSALFLTRYVEGLEIYLYVAFLCAEKGLFRVSAVHIHVHTHFADEHLSIPCNNLTVFSYSMFANLDSL